MKRILLAAFLVLAASSALFAQWSNGNRISVGDWTTVINAAEPGDTIYLTNDIPPLSSALEIKKSVSIVGNHGHTNGRATITPGANPNWIFLLKASGVTFENITFSGDPNRQGAINGEGTNEKTNITITNCIFTNFGEYGILLQTVSDCTITDSLFTNIGAGFSGCMIELGNAENVGISNNTFYVAGLGTSMIGITGSADITITSNNFFETTDSKKISAGSSTGVWCGYNYLDGSDPENERYGLSAGVTILPGSYRFGLPHRTQFGTSYPPNIAAIAYASNNTAGGIDYSFSFDGTTTNINGTNTQLLIFASKKQIPAYRVGVNLSNATIDIPNSSVNSTDAVPTNSLPDGAYYYYFALQNEFDTSKFSYSPVVPENGILIRTRLPNLSAVSTSMEGYTVNNAFPTLALQTESTEPIVTVSVTDGTNTATCPFREFFPGLTFALPHEMTNASKYSFYITDTYGVNSFLPLKTISNHKTITNTLKMHSFTITNVTPSGKAKFVVNAANGDSNFSIRIGYAPGAFEITNFYDDITNVTFIPNYALIGTITNLYDDTSINSNKDHVYTTSNLTNAITEIGVDLSLFLNKNADYTFVAIVEDYPAGYFYRYKTLAFSYQSDIYKLLTPANTIRVYNSIIRNAEDARVFFNLEEDAKRVEVNVYSRSGKLVKRLLKERALERGGHELFWDGTTQNGQDAGNGVFYVTLLASGVRHMVKVMRLVTPKE